MMFKVVIFYVHCMGFLGWGSGATQCDRAETVINDFLHSHPNAAVQSIAQSPDVEHGEAMITILYKE
jgi:hypothetical protein